MRPRSIFVCNLRVRLLGAAQVEARWALRADFSRPLPKAMPPRSRRAAHELALQCLTKDEVSENDVLSVLRLWYFKANKVRVNVMPQGVTSVYSDTLGLVRTPVGKILCSSATMKYWAVTALFGRWLTEHLPACFAKVFPFSSISVNFASPPVHSLSALGAAQ